MALGTGLANPPQRILQRQVFGSPSFTFRNSSTIAADGSLLIDFADTDSTTRKYLPFDSIDITNLDSTTNLEVRLNDRTDHRENVLVNSRVFTQPTPIGLTSVRVVNLNSSTATGANNLIIVVRKAEFDADSKAKQEEAKRLGFGSLFPSSSVIGRILSFNV